MNGIQKTANRDRGYEKPSVQDQGLVRRLTRGDSGGSDENIVWGQLLNPPVGSPIKTRE